MQVPDAWLATDEARRNGEALYREHCVLCHGERLDGRGLRRAGLVSPPRDLRNAAWRSRVTPLELFVTIREGRPGTAMPAWPSYRDEEVWALVAFLRAAGTPSIGPRNGAEAGGADRGRGRSRPGE